VGDWFLGMEIIKLITVICDGGAYYIRRIINCNIYREIKFSITAIAGVSSPNCGDKVEVQFLFMACCP
tara:strand:+ start:529 stop:732 length:204 start_codon:yes stop_codon:yes gene_type:complete